MVGSIRRTGFCIQIKRTDNIETSVFQPKSYAARATEKVECNRSCYVSCHKKYKNMMMMELLEQVNRDADRPANITVYKQVMCSAS